MMVRSFILSFLLFGFSATLGAGERPLSLPFDVKLAGQVPIPAGDVAKLTNPITNDAELEVMVSSTETIFVNFFIADANGHVDNKNSQATEIMLINGSNKAKINQTMSKNGLKVGTYLANIMAQNQTARIVFTIK